MTGIMLKDLWEAFCLKKNAIAWIFSLVVYAFTLILMPSKYIYILWVAVMLPMTGSSVLQYSIEQDEISKFDKIMLTYPITKREVILSKYLSGMILQVMVFLVNFITALICSFGYKVIDFPAAMKVWFLGVIFSFFYMAINYMMFLWLGNKKGTILYFIFTGVIAFVYVLGYFGIDMNALYHINKTLAMVLGFIISVLSLIGSYYACVKIYTKKHIK